VIEGESVEEDRLYLENAIKKREISWYLPLTLPTLLSDSGKRLFFPTSLQLQRLS
jgi:hypothetical protein